MNRIFYNTFIFIIALFLGGIAIVFSIRPDDGERLASVSKAAMVWSKVSILTNLNGSLKIQSESIEPNDAKVSQDTPILVDFGRLSSFLYLAQNTSSQSGVIDKKSSTGVVIGDVSGIVSLYDLFTTYTLFDASDAFRMEQITNGSFYIGKEKDGKIAIYAIDGVARLIFLDTGKDMTSMILFPGSYIRFDPSRNRSLKNADLFRTILSLKDTDNEVFEFVNPRVNIGDEQDTFFNYRLPKKSMILFRILSTRFKEKVEKMDLSGTYSQSYAYDPNMDSSTLLLNPSKINHNMLLELSALLSKAVTNSSSSDTLVVKIGNIYNQAKGLDVKDTTAKNLVEQFLLDGRFALYAGLGKATKYQDTYEAIAKIIGIEPISAKSQLLQNLANIYSKNLFTQKKTTTGLTINTYTPTALKLLETLEKNEIEQKDNFDIAIYAFNIMKKMEERISVLPTFAMIDNATYSYLITFFRASTRYIASIDDLDKKQDAVMGFSRQFYDSMLTTIINSLYKTFVTVENNALFIQSDFRDGVRLTIAPDIYDNIRSMYATIEGIAPSVDSLWSPDTETDSVIKNRIRTNIIRLQAFVNMIDPDTYKDYVKSPYLYMTGAEFPFPSIDTLTDTILRVDPEEIQAAKNKLLLATDPRITELKKIWPDADASSWLIEGTNIRVVRAPFKIARGDAGTSNLKISALYQEKTFRDTYIEYGDYKIRVSIKPDMSLASYRGFLLEIQYYLDVIDEEVANGRTDIGEIMIQPVGQRITLGESVYTVEIPE